MVKRRSVFDPLRRLRALTLPMALIAASQTAEARPGQAASSPAPLPRLKSDVVVTATVAPVSLEALSRAVTIVTREEMEQLGIRSLIEALRFVPGVDARARGPRDVQTDFSVRGSTFGQNLVLVDGVRLNDSQSGHHNGEIPLPSVAIDRIEIVAGAGSTTHGADALGGTINVISRREPHALLTASVGEHGFADLQASMSGRVIPAGWSLSGWSSRSRGFMFDRDFAIGGLAVRGSPAAGLIVDVRHQRRAFGANGFYGNSPSKEWTDQTMASALWQTSSPAWTTTTRGLVRNHGDHFRWDINRPGFAENRHRTNAVEGHVDVRRRLGSNTLTLGGSAGGDMVESSNLGDHGYGRGSLFAELQSPVATRATLVVGVRVDSYSVFGEAVSPSVSVVSSVAPNVQVRASAGHAFRIPTFTELYYSDPNTLGNVGLRAERGWTVDGGVDATNGRWNGSLSVFRRWDQDVIDFVRSTPAERFMATNVRDVTARGFEASVSRRWASALVRAHYSGLWLEAPTLTLESRYVLEYARRQAGLSLSAPVGAGVRAALNIDHRLRRDGQSYELVSARVGRVFGRFDLFVEGSNLLGERYREIAGVDMPGRWMTAGVTVR